MRGLRIHAEPDTARATQPFGFVEQTLSDGAFGVIADDDGVGSFEVAFEFADEIVGHFRGDVTTGFAIDANNLLAMGDDACFDACGAAGISHQAAAPNAAGAK